MTASSDRRRSSRRTTQSRRSDRAFGFGAPQHRFGAPTPESAYLTFPFCQRSGSRNASPAALHDSASVDGCVRCEARYRLPSASAAIHGWRKDVLARLSRSHSRAAVSSRGATRSKSAWSCGRSVFALYSSWISGARYGMPDELVRVSIDSGRLIAGSLRNNQSAPSDSSSMSSNTQGVVPTGRHQSEFTSDRGGMPIGKRVSTPSLASHHSHPDNSCRTLRMSRRSTPTSRSPWVRLVSSRNISNAQPPAIHHFTARRSNRVAAAAGSTERQSPSSLVGETSHMTTWMMDNLQDSFNIARSGPSCRISKFHALNHMPGWRNWQTHRT
jgi:hypothetical protein